ncbi:TPA: DUF1272 domain-containing protein [Elizabethkingia anophelis]|uniref:DUF1272 domain-containing protein n=1 Tax=Elizabethkingia anophelis TaxID=1117645 RepID=UPI00040EA3F6|nr:DUF1272 domain-containing protein [Elizabethkingia anophelis]MCT3743145.1 DUF1272 domain-containing protein [Elizabethkingia anophelis]MDC8025770.1 DUF1272 domain-containing protein [Elizabethkingia anophelis]MDV3490736.1 DUF1272 domain-containing protein [Elizabethkingia anophelis]HAT3991251.1 DUF1272 domain-containing protein [Elizabethkingia anophelis]HAT3994926.1 DUF1272 domain-containing protein [Elizabethkingia anophelis]
MLELRTICENCGKKLPPDSEEAMICTFECTFCKDCVEQVLENVCPNCGGGFERRPVRPQSFLEKYPVIEKVIFKPVDPEKFKVILEKYRDIKPSER